MPEWSGSFWIISKFWTKQANFHTTIYWFLFLFCNQKGLVGIWLKTQSAIIEIRIWPRDTQHRRHTGQRAQKAERFCQCHLRKEQKKKTQHINMCTQSRKSATMARFSLFTAVCSAKTTNKKEAEKPRVKINRFAEHLLESALWTAFRICNCRLSCPSPQGTGWLRCVYRSSTFWYPTRSKAILSTTGIALPRPFVQQGVSRKSSSPHFGCTLPLRHHCLSHSPLP